MSKMKKKVLFIIPSAKIGGSVVSLFNLLSLKDSQIMPFDLFVMNHTGEFIDNARSLNLLPEDRKLGSILCEKSRVLKRFGLLGLMNRIFYVMSCKILGKKNAIEYQYKAAAKKLSNHYSCVIAFQEDMATRFGQYVSSEKKIAWIHNDYDKIYGDKDLLEIKRIYDQYDEIVCVSRASMDSMISNRIKKAQNIHLIYNTLDQENIQILSKEQQIHKDKDTFLIVSVGRFARQKAFDRIPEVAKQLKGNGMKFKWIIVGGGELYNDVVKEAEDYSITDYIEFIGPTSNPYPYIRSADLMVVTSLYEAHPMVVNEALILNTPVLSTRFSSVEEIISDCKNGFICENSVEGIKSCLQGILNDRMKYVYVKNSIKGFHYDNEGIINQIYQLVLSM